ncbi:hypothetical protein BAE44_0024704 [Dichanthelium oligosanthes]|uniref:Uncharacterized protein n=1 Tax=Dichanthelium oligosanthes TaxID=888268 RepID=A0A1E5UN20_9POAL|nr:hypothetical protein BAE44_0024704 [Dichanthelium oligosanthes]
MANTVSGEHRVRIPARVGAGQADQGAAKPEKQLNAFVRAVALIERLGNALGTLAFTWATVVLLGGYPTVLSQDDDFWLATAIVFLEAARMFSRNNRLDYQLFFHTKGAKFTHSRKWMLVMLVFMSGDSNIQLAEFLYQVYALVLVSIGNFQIPAAVARVMLTLFRLAPQDYYGDNADDPAKTNLAPSLNIFYLMVFAQGILYFVACLLEIFSFIPRRALARHGGFKGNIIGELASMICEGNNKYVAARLLQNLFQHIQPEFRNSDLRKICETLPKVLDAILDAETEVAELEVLIGLSAQICRVIPEDFSQELENGHRKEIFVKRLVDVLKTNMHPAVHCPGIRRVVIEQAIYLMTCSSRYANVLNQYCMMEALLMVEHTPSRVERYRIFLGGTGIMKHKEPPTNLVAIAKELLCRQWVRGISNVNRQGM